MQRNIKVLVYMVLLLACTVFLVAGSMSAQGQANKDQLIGTWRINIDKSSFGRNGPGKAGMHPSETWTWVFSEEKGGIRFSNYLTYPLPKPSRTFWFKADGKEYPCTETSSCFESGTSEGETLSLTRITPYFFTRLGKRNGAIKEFVSYAVSSDGKVFTVTAWSPETPEYQNVMVFDRLQ